MNVCISRVVIICAWYKTIKQCNQKFQNKQFLHQLMHTTYRISVEMQYLLNLDAVWILYVSRFVDYRNVYCLFLLRQGLSVSRMTFHAIEVFVSLDES